MVRMSHVLRNVFFGPSLKNKSESQEQSNIMMPETVSRVPLLEGFFNLRPALLANCVYKKQDYTSLT